MSAKNDYEKVYLTTKESRSNRTMTKRTGKKESEDSNLTTKQRTSKKRINTGKKVGVNAQKVVINCSNEDQDDAKKSYHSSTPAKRKKTQIFEVLMKKAQKQDIAMFKIREEMKSLNSRIENLTVIATQNNELLLELCNSRSTRPFTPEYHTHFSQVNRIRPQMPASTTTFNNGQLQCTHQQNQGYSNAPPPLVHYNSQHFFPFPINQHYNRLNNNQY